MLSHSTTHIAGELNFRVRNGNGCNLSALVANKITVVSGFIKLLLSMKIMEYKESDYKPFTQHVSKFIYHSDKGNGLEAADNLRKVVGMFDVALKLENTQIGKIFVGRTASEMILGYLITLNADKVVDWYGGREDSFRKLYHFLIHIQRRSGCSSEFLYSANSILNVRELRAKQ